MDCRMVHTFATHEDAAIFAAAKRAEGYHAEILDEGMGMLYGPLAIGGIRVIVSEEAIPIDDEEEKPDSTVPLPAMEKSEDGEFLKTVRMLAVGIVAIGLVALVIMLLSVFSNNPGGLLLELVHLLKYPLVIGVVFAVMGPFMLDFTRWLRGEKVSADGGILRWLLLAALIPFLLLVIAFL